MVKVIVPTFPDILFITPWVNVLLVLLEEPEGKPTPEATIFDTLKEGCVYGLASS